MGYSPRRIGHLFRQKGEASQKRFYDTVWNTRAWRGVLRGVFTPLTFRLMYGRPFMRRFGKGDLTGEWIQKIERGFTAIPVRSNYFLSQFLWGRYLPGEMGLPPYLRAGIFEQVRAHAGRIRWMTEDLPTHLAKSEPGRFNKMTLSNVFEWLPEESILPSFSALANVLPAKGRAVVRHLLGITPLPDHLPIREEKALSDQLSKNEKAFLYSRVSVYDRF